MVDTVVGKKKQDKKTRGDRVLKPRSYQNRRYQQLTGTASTACACFLLLKRLLLQMTAFTKGNGRFHRRYGRARQSTSATPRTPYQPARQSYQPLTASQLHAPLYSVLYLVLVQYFIVFGRKKRRGGGGEESTTTRMCTINTQVFSLCCVPLS